ncbi:hypothetical protein TIFTF001_003754 [Ficus carica]|uniref:Uncharacterized protein n=1 Tax=Ficus carica TaxID=3494 RepID=A0AA87ZG95_FICCA|nr:hypothetical protein TIFTF001_003754 [Ficus carica]
MKLETITTTQPSLQNLITTVLSSLKKENDNFTPAFYTLFGLLLSLILLFKLISAKSCRSLKFQILNERHI